MNATQHMHKIKQRNKLASSQNVIDGKEAELVPGWDLWQLRLYPQPLGEMTAEVIHTSRGACDGRENAEIQQRERLRKMRKSDEQTSGMADGSRS